MGRYVGKKVVIIGGTSGIGLATAKMLVKGGARVLVTGRSQTGLESARKELGEGEITVSPTIASPKLVETVPSISIGRLVFPNSLSEEQPLYAVDVEDTFRNQSFPLPSKPSIVVFLG